MATAGATRALLAADGGCCGKRCRRYTEGVASCSLRRTRGSTRGWCVSSTAAPRRALDGRSLLRARAWLRRKRPPRSSGGRNARVRGPRWTQSSAWRASGCDCGRMAPSPWRRYGRRGAAVMVWSFWCASRVRWTTNGGRRRGWTSGSRELGVRRARGWRQRRSGRGRRRCRRASARGWTHVGSAACWRWRRDGRTRPRSPRRAAR